MRAIWLGALAACALLSADAAAQVPDSETPWETGRELYRDENFDEAARYITEAIQREPENPQYYLGLARTEYWRGRYDLAVYYYDLYLGPLAAMIPSSARSADRPDRVREERNSANASRPNPQAPVAMPQAHASARQFVETRLSEGPIMTSTGGGAYAQYRGMLAAGYANPDIAQLRARVASALLVEADAVVSDHDTSLPLLTLNQWQTQRARFEAWRSLSPPPAGASTTSIPSSALDPSARPVDPQVRADAHIALCDAQIQYLNENYAQAADGFRRAFDLMPNLLPARIGRLNSLYRLGNSSSTVESEIAALDTAVSRHAPVSQGIGDIYRAAFAAQRGDVSGAARTLGRLLGIP